MRSFIHHKPGQGIVARSATAAGIAILWIGIIVWVNYELDKAFASTWKNYYPTLGQIAQEYQPFVPAEDGSGLQLNMQLKVTPEAALAIQQRYGEPPIRLGVRARAGRTPLSPVVTAIDTETGVLTLEKPLKNQIPKEYTNAQGETVATTVQTGEPVNRLVWLQGGVGVTLFLAGLVFIFWIVNKPKVVDFLIATETEMRKVNWPRQREVTGSTMVVIAGTLIMAGFLWVVNLIFADFFVLIHILEGRSSIAQFFNWLMGG